MMDYFRMSECQKNDKKKLLMGRWPVTSPRFEKFLAKIGTRMTSELLFFFFWLVIENTIDLVKMQSENGVIQGNRK